VNAGDTFIPARFDNHLWVIISEPSLDKQNVVIVNLTTYDGVEEQTCTLDVGDHRFVKHKTVVRYRDAKSVPSSHLEKLERAQMLRRHDPLSAELLRRIREGASRSDFLPEQCRKILDTQGLI